MLAKLIVHDVDRKAALEQGIKALKDTLILGVTTNTDYLARILNHPSFLAGKVDTDFIPQYDKDLKSPTLNKEERNMLLAATALSSSEFVDPAFKVPEPHCFLGNWRN